MKTTTCGRTRGGQVVVSGCYSHNAVYTRFRTPWKEPSLFIDRASKEGNYRLYLSHSHHPIQTSVCINYIL